MRSPPRTLTAARTRLPLPKVRHALFASRTPAQNTRSPRRADIKECSAEIVHNASVPVLVEAALQRESGSYLTSTGALAVRSGAKTGRSPKDKRIVEESTSVDNVWWGPVNIKMEEKSFMLNRECAARLPTHPHDRCVHRAHPRLSPWQARPRLPPHARSDLRRGRLRRLGPQVPRQRARALLAGIPCSIHEEHAGETLAVACGTPMQPPRKCAHARRACCRSRSLQPTWTPLCRIWSSSTPAASPPTGTWTASPPRAPSTCTWAATRSASTGRRWERASPKPRPRALHPGRVPLSRRLPSISISFAPHLEHDLAGGDGHPGHAVRRR